jgi:pimeloyl-ACP methyl ester carboxylesterase
MSNFFARGRLKCPKTTPARRIQIMVLAMFVVFISQGAPVQAQEKTPPVPAPTAVAEASRFQMRVVGQGKDVILIPGLGSSSEVWAATAETLQKSYRVHTLQVAGFAGAPAGGNVSAHAGESVVAPTVAALQDYIVRQQLRAPIVVGHSIGGLMAMELALQYPHSVGKIVVVDALPYVGLMFSPQASVAAFEPQAKFMRDQMIGMPDAAFSAQQAAGVVRLVSGPADQARVAAWALASDRHVFAQTFYDAMTMDVRPRLATLKTPATLFYAFDASAGQQEAPTDAMFRGGYQTLPNMRFRRFDNSRHFIMLDQPMAFVQALAEELALR